MTGFRVNSQSTGLCCEELSIQPSIINSRKVEKEGWESAASAMYRANKFLVCTV